MLFIVIVGLVLLGTGVMLVLRGATSSRGGGTTETIGQIESYGFAATPPDVEEKHHQPLRSLAGQIGSLSERVMGTGERGIRANLLAAGMYDVDPARIAGY